MGLPVFGLEGKVAMVTGAAGGIGQALALGLARAGAELVITSRNSAGLDDTRRQVESLGRQCLPLALDLTSCGGIPPAVDLATESFGKVDILVNNAGVVFSRPAEAITESEWDQTFAVNVKGLFFCCQAVGRKMIAQGGGKIINVSSTFAFVAFAGRTAYAASKAAVSQVTKNLAVEWAPHQINVNAIAPCATQTPGRKELFDDPSFYQTIVKKIPLGRLAETEDLVGATVFLASPAAAMVTGQTILVDGGWTAW